MTAIDLTKLIPKYDFDKGGTVFKNYIQLYQDLINELISSNETIYTIFDCRYCDQKYLPYLALLLGYEWDYNGNVEKQRYEMLSIVERRKRAGTLWFFEDMFKNLGLTAEIRELIHHVITLSGPEVLSGDFYIEGLEKYHEGSMEVIVEGYEVPWLYDLIRLAIPAGMHLHVVFTNSAFTYSESTNASDTYSAVGIFNLSVSEETHAVDY